MAKLQTIIFAQRRFTLDFLSKIETVVLKLQELGYQWKPLTIKNRSGRTLENWAPETIQVHCDYDTMLPQHALSGPETMTK